jgi:hypothetical protein
MIRLKDGLAIERTRAGYLMDQLLDKPNTKKDQNSSGLNAPLD